VTTRSISRLIECTLLTVSDTFAFKLGFFYLRPVSRYVSSSKLRQVIKKKYMKVAIFPCAVK